MITTLSIKNYALIEDIRVDFQSGLTVITGETGAGKSILLGAMGLLLGKRADATSVKNPKKKCVVEAHFSISGYNLQPVFEAFEIDFEPETIIRRELLPGGKSRAFINDSPVMLSQLQALAPFLVDIHGQHETLELASENFQMEIIDAMAGNAALIQNFQKQHANFNKVSNRLSSLKSQKEVAAKEMDYHSFLLRELQMANLQKTNQAALEELLETLNHAEEIQESLLKGFQIFQEENIGTLQTAKEGRLILGRIKNFSPAFETIWDRLNAVIIELEDISEEMQATAAKTEADPGLLFQTNETLQQVYQLQQKHNVATVAELLALQDELEQKINASLNLEEQIQASEAELLELKKAAVHAGLLLHNKREEIIPNLKKELERYLNDLGLPNARFQFQLENSGQFKKNGTDTLELLFTANKGLASGPLKKVASGGEMSRIMLAVKAVLAHYKTLPTLVFDEIDSGVSGEIAKKMANIMGEMSNSMQVLTITHLPQIAAKGEHHIKVYKEDLDEITVTRLKALNENERIVEIAQMLGGNNATEAALANAKELLN